MTPGKRALDLVLALLLAIPLAPVALVLAILILIRDGRPVFYVSERMKTVSEPFQLWKFRTMTTVDTDSGVSGGDKAARLTKHGRFLRRTRMDEIPQLWNVLRGDISFVGPRPPLREYVERFPAVYAQVLKSRPGVTGLATLIYHRHEDRILARCKSAAATEAAYYRRCLPVKLKIDLIYQRHRDFGLDLWILWSTVKIVLTRKDERPRRRGRA